jgi:hypothetical protein
MKPWRVYRPVVADSHHFDEEQDPDPHLSEKLAPDPHLSEKLDPELFLNLQ